MSVKEENTRIYTIPLKKAWITPKYRRAKKAIKIIKEFAERHMKATEVRISTQLNELIWSRGIEKPPRRVTVKMKKDEEGIVRVTLPSEEAPSS